MDRILFILLTVAEKGEDTNPWQDARSYAVKQILKLIRDKDEILRARPEGGAWYKTKISRYSVGGSCGS